MGEIGNKPKSSIGNPAWVKGTSGNPKGRPKIPRDVIEAARAHTLEAIETLADIMRNGSDDSPRVRSAEALLDRGWGKAAQLIGEDPDHRFASLSDAEILVKLELAKKVLAGK